MGLCAEAVETRENQICDWHDTNACSLHSLHVPKISRGTVAAADQTDASLKSMPRQLEAKAATWCCDAMSFPRLLAACKNSRAVDDERGILDPCRWRTNRTRTSSVFAHSSYRQELAVLLYTLHPHRHRVVARFVVEIRLAPFRLLAEGLYSFGTGTPHVGLLEQPPLGLGTLYIGSYTSPIFV